jgi:hypothetical protein
MNIAIARLIPMTASIFIKVLYSERTGRLMSTVENGTSDQKTEGILEFECADFAGDYSGTQAQKGSTSLP